MLNFLKSHYLSTTIFPLIIFNILFKKINSISGTNSEVFSGDGVTTSSNDLCPCDMTEGVCDNGCYCDRDCLDFLLSNDYFSSFLIDESSYTENNIDSKLDYCDDYIESVDDLYNPLVLAFKILKRGFCLVNKKDREDEEDTEDYDKSLESYEIKTESEDKNGASYAFEEFKSSANDFNVDLSNKNNHFGQLTIFLPTSLPNGLCLFHTYQLSKNIDYEVTCSYSSGSRENVINEFSDDNLEIIKYIIYIDNIYIYTNDAVTGDHYLKKVEIIYYNQPTGNKNYEINHYYEATSDNYIDLTIDVKFVMNEADFKLSGNPGYKKGKQIIFLDGSNIFNKGIVFPIEKPNDSGTSTSGKYIYFDNYIDNKITFEDLIIYGYSYQNNLKDFKDLITNSLSITPFGNGKYLNDKTVNIEINENSQNFILVGEYKDSGSVNNTQFQIHSLKSANQFNIENKIKDYTKYSYFIIKFVKVETETEWYYARSPVIIKLPKNIMYPFKIGTSKYKK